MLVEYTCAHCGKRFFDHPSQRQHAWVSCSVACRGLSRPKLPAEVLFWRNVEKGDGCWLWTGSTNGVGYGQFKPGGRQGQRQYAHRFSFALHRFPIPPGMVIAHACDTPRCVRPDHLFLATRGDNNLDSKLKGRNARGERNGHARLTEERVRIIRAMPLAPYAQLHRWAAEWGIHYRTIYAASRFKTWRHIDT